MKQIVAHKKLSALQGVLLVLGLVVILLLINYIAVDYLARLLGYTAATFGFWILGGLLAWMVLRIYIVCFIYEMDADILRLSRRYGKRERHIEDIYLNNILYVGAPQEAKKRHPQAKRVSAVHAGSKERVTAVVYQSSAGVRMALMQANDELRAKLLERVRGK